MTTPRELIGRATKWINVAIPYVESGHHRADGIALIDALDANLSEPQPVLKPLPFCKGDPGECAYNKACMYACGRFEPPTAPVEQPAQAASGFWTHRVGTQESPTALDMVRMLRHPESQSDLKVSALFVADTLERMIAAPSAQPTSAQAQKTWTAERMRDWFACSKPGDVKPWLADPTAQAQKEDE